jgi:hypothetical protein
MFRSVRALHRKARRKRMLGVLRIWVQILVPVTVVSVIAYCIFNYVSKQP